MFRVPVSKLKRRAGLALLLFAVVTLVAAIVWVTHIWAGGLDLNRFKPELALRAQQALHRELVLKGDLRLSVVPLGVAVRDVTLLDPVASGGQPFVRVGDARLAIDLGEYLKTRAIKVTHVQLSDIEIQLRQDAQGKLNIDDLLANPAPRLTLPAELSSVVAREARVRWDRPNAPPLLLTLQSFSAGAIVLQQPIAISARGTLAGLNSTPLPFELSSALTLDAEGDQFVLTDTALSVSAPLFAVASPTLAAKRVVHRRKGLGTRIEALALTGSVREDWRGPVSLDVANIDVRDNAIIAQQVALQADLQTAKDAATLKMNVTLPAVKRKAAEGRAGVVTGEWKGQAAWRANGQREAQGDWTGQVFSDGARHTLSELAGQITAKDGRNAVEARISKGGITYAAERVDAQFDLASTVTHASIGRHAWNARLVGSRETSVVTARAEGTLDGARMVASVTRADAAPWQVGATLQQIDLARWLPTKAPAPVAWNQSISSAVGGVRSVLDAVSRAPLRGQVRVDEVIDSRGANTVRAKEVKIELE